VTPRPELERALRTAEEIELLTTGRRTGRPHAVTVWSAYEDGGLWLRADRDADWYRNLRAEPRCRVRVNGIEVEAEYEPFAAVREPIADNDSTLRHVIGLWRSKYGNEWVGDWYVERGRVPVRIRIVDAP
jgi:deazaflavin-dependent oxidoreductase (nitroreductase family)